MPLLRSRTGGGGRNNNGHQNGNDDDAKEVKYKENPTSKSIYQRIKVQLIIYTICSILLCSIIYMFSSPSNDDGGKLDVSISEISPTVEKHQQLAPMGKIIYGAKSKGDDTSRLVKEAINAGFRHIATGGFHNEYNEKGVGMGWKASGIPRNELYLQTLFLARSVNGYSTTTNCNLPNNVCPPSDDLSIEEDVNLAINSSLYNLQTDYLDAVLVHNFRAKLQPYEETIQVWRVLEKFVDMGTIRHLGIVSVHDKDYLTKLHNEARIKPLIIQNRFHSNRGYDINLRPTFQEFGLANQLFWILTGSAGGRIRNNVVVKDLAAKKNVSPQILLYSFTMEIGGSPLIGTKSVSHMKDDVDALVRNKIQWEKDDLITMASVINKNLIQ